MVVFSLIYTSFGDGLGTRMRVLIALLTCEGEINEPTANPMVVLLLIGIRL